MEEAIVQSSHCATLTELRYVESKYYYACMTCRPLSHATFGLFPGLGGRNSVRGDGADHGGAIDTGRYSRAREQ